ncbi:MULTISPECIES: class I SAM-dependent methyltransferase [unclassified Coleofasciculus]|uniref:class I SAM-dependent methyltransferase n=1 Tax=unclassified Coleofasciculus TaxID=2692782 RepID=UPI0018825E4A|nr:MULTISPECIES: class I SAM-dependent methyltransferase [unclassified Coleofasciculus]MBE9126100.1 methyltransferase domain-containing protein [Coleofasciculus sp. LEGE 07081]MBE9147545.1 methyltransferase domain-containing protein [Coleofasciculus sp. LEGE 07092]
MNPTSSIHNAAAQGFQIAATAYERGRPEYPQEAVHFLLETLDISPEKTVLDLGAGTGKFTRLLTCAGAKLIAVEPVEGMRRQFSSLLPGIEIMFGTAESIPLASASVDVVLVAQAFHWFQGKSSLQEIHRVLKPGGWLGLIWNVRDESVEWVISLWLCKRLG